MVSEWSVLMTCLAVLSESDFYCGQMTEFGLAETRGQSKLSATGFHEVLVDYPKHRFTVRPNITNYVPIIQLYDLVKNHRFCQLLSTSSVV